MKLKALYQHVIKKGIEADIRNHKDIALVLGSAKESHEKLTEKQKALFDPDVLFNPFSDTRILCGNPDCNISSMIVGIDVDVGELLFTDLLKNRGTDIDLVVSHHPAGRAYASFYEVMDLQIDIFAKEGVSMSAAENLLSQRKSEVERKVHAANHERSVDIAKLLKLNFLCMHTPCDNLASQYIRKLIDETRPKTLSKVIDFLFDIPEYSDAAKHNNPPKIVNGSGASRVSKIHVEFTGGTEGPVNIYGKLASLGVDTIIAMHQSEEHFKKCKDENINVIFAPHVASDALGVNLMLDDLQKKEKFKIYEFSGFRRFTHKK